jgi:hypothetical protein
MKNTFNIIIKEPMQWIGNLGYTLNGVYNEDQIIDKIREILLKEGITADIDISYKRIKLVNNLGDIQDFINDA